MDIPTEGLQTFELISNESMSNNKFMDWSPSVTLEVENSYINNDLFAELFLSKPNSNQFDVEFDMPERVRVRKHKKKRIDKKWLKCYGYKTVCKKIKAKASFEEASDVKKSVTLGRQY